jgi:hypothetical protein
LGVGPGGGKPPPVTSLSYNRKGAIEPDERFS